MNLKPSIFSVVNADLCTGCGSCVFQNQSNDLKMDWNQDGFLVPCAKKNSVQIAETAINVCPFNPHPDDKVRTENELADIFLQDAPNLHPKVGRYFNTYAGYSKQYRLTSSSGGIATYILNQLFEQKIIDAVITVGEGTNNHYEYKLVKRKEDLLITSKTKYYPVTMAEALNNLRSFEGKVAIVGIGCFIKAVRLLQYYTPEIYDKIVFTIGIICGGLKSKFFGEYLAAKAGIQNNEFSKPQFRIKDYNSTAGDYSFGCIDMQGSERQVKMRTVGDMWGTGIFKCNACDFCDDVTSELADISLGDAWMPPYSADGRGTNVIVTRSNLANTIIVEGMKSNALSLEVLSLETFLKSQQGSFNHRHKGLRFRMKLYSHWNKDDLPIKRFASERIAWYFRKVQKQRMNIRKLSLILWKNDRNAIKFDHNISSHRQKLFFWTGVYHRIERIKNIIKEL